MILIVTNKLDEHADAVIKRLHERAVRFTRLNTEDYPTQVRATAELNGETRVALELPKRAVDLRDISSVWFRRPQPPTPDDQIQDVLQAKYSTEQSLGFLANLWNLASHCFWVNHPVNNRRCESKIWQLERATSFGLLIPRTIVTNDSARARQFVDATAGGVIVKSLVPSEPQPGTAFFTHRLTSQDLQYLDDVAFAPCMFQEYVEKDVELRVTVIGQKIFAAALHSQETQDGVVDWRRALDSGLRHTVYELPTGIAQKCLRLVRSFGLNFAALDFVVTPTGQHVFLEINPNGQWVWIERMTGLPMIDAMVDLLDRGS